MIVLPLSVASSVSICIAFAFLFITMKNLYKKCKKCDTAAAGKRIQKKHIGGTLFFFHYIAALLKQHSLRYSVSILHKSNHFRCIYHHAEGKFRNFNGKSSTSENESFFRRSILMRRRSSVFFIFSEKQPMGIKHRKHQDYCFLFIYVEI